ncbi:DUF4919 domain-containing protein [Phenylobacterium sp.]|jgi:hypothetical protein|uniref:DUF4919 domain-containing protein n=1 Tax=Phenylobacterium sp. TaxID=1871053 RepID=UPI002F425947
MRKTTLIVAAAAWMSLAPALVLAQPQTAAARYQDLLGKAKAGGTVDWVALRFAYADYADDQGQDLRDRRRKMLTALNASDYAAAKAQAEAIIAAAYVDGEAHLIESIAERHLNQIADADREQAVALAVLKSIQTGDGSSQATAFTVISVDEEYELMRARGRQVTQQALVRDGGHAYDVLTTVNESRQPQVFYFQIDRVMASESRMFSGKKP